MAKRGVSDVVATVLIVMISVAAISILYIGVMPLIRDKLGSSDVCNDVDVSIETSQGYTCVSTSKNMTLVGVKVSESNVNVLKLKFSIVSSGNSISYTKNLDDSKNLYRLFYLNTSEISSIEKLEVYPIIKAGNTLEICQPFSIQNVKECSVSALSESEVVSAISSGNFLNRDSGGGGSDDLGNVVTSEEKLLCNNDGDCEEGKYCSVSKCMDKVIGDGTLESPFRIYTCEELQDVGNNLRANYSLARDVDCSATVNWNCQNNICKGFVPIGNSTNAFTGNFNGNGFDVVNLYINRSAEDNIGLFGLLDYGDISNVGVVGANITGNSSVGALVGFARIEILYNKNGVRISNSISNSYSTGNVYGSAAVGGLVGGCSGTVIANSYSASNVINTTNVWTASGFGGLVGETNNRISNSYATGNIRGYVLVGGLVGEHWWGNISNSYATGNVSGFTYVGGLIGRFVSDNTRILNSFSTGRVYANAPNQYYSDFVGVGPSNNFISNSYYNNGSFNRCYKYQTTSYQPGDFGCTAVENISYFLNSSNAPMNVWNKDIWNLTEDGYPTLK